MSAVSLITPFAVFQPDNFPRHSRQRYHRRDARPPVRRVIVVHSNTVWMFAHEL
jgi:hypothetical protein